MLRTACDVVPQFPPMSDEIGSALALPAAIEAARTRALQSKPSFRDTDRFLSVVRGG